MRRLHAARTRSRPPAHPVVPDQHGPLEAERIDEVEQVAPERRELLRGTDASRKRVGAKPRSAGASTR